MKVIKNATILWENLYFKKGNLLFDETGIKAFCDEFNESEMEEVIDGEGYLLSPGFIDVHVHLREPGFEYKETIKTGTQAAAHGGFTTVMAMPNLNPHPDNVETMTTYLQKIAQDAIVNVVPYANITKKAAGKELVDFKALSELGIHAVSDDGVGVAREEVMLEAMKQAKACGTIIVAHTEDMEYRKGLACMHEGIRNKELGLPGIPSACEYAQFQRDLKLVEQSGVAYHVCHMSAIESVNSLKEAKEKGLDVSGEVTAHHLLLNEMDVMDANHKMNPPLRSKEDQEALIQGLLDGTIDMIANDHAPHSEEEKAKGMEKAPFGIVALETAFPLLYTRFVKDTQTFTLPQLVRWMSEAPAKRFGFNHKGMLKEGYDADMILVDINEMRKVDKNAFYSLGKNTPFDGWEAYGWIMQTYCGGKLVYKR